MSVEHIIVDKIERKDVARPSMTGHICSHLLEAMDQYPRDQKFKLVLVPIYELEHDHATEYIDDYLTEHKPTEEQLKEDIEKLMSIPPEELKKLIQTYYIPSELMFPKIMKDDMLIPDKSDE